MTSAAEAYAHELVVAADGLLRSVGYRNIMLDAIESGPLVGAYEDVYSFVGVAYFGSVAEMLGEWVEAQEQIAVLTTSVTQLGAKAWDGYLVLLTDQMVLDRETAQVAVVRGDTRRLRKLVVTGDNLVRGAAPIPAVTALNRGLAPLLPVQIPPETQFVDPLATLATRIHVAGASPHHIDAVVTAHQEGSPMVARLHELLTRGDEA